MRRRNFIRSASIAAGVIAAAPGLLLSKSNSTHFQIMSDDDNIKKMASLAIDTCMNLNASYSDFRLTNIRSQNISARENTIQSIRDEENFGFAVRVIIHGAWGFAASSTFTESEVKRISEIACRMAKANRSIQKRKVELVPVNAYEDTWRTPVIVNPFDVSIDDKVKLLFEINDKAKSLGANFCESSIWAVNEWKCFASSAGSFIKQDIYRIYPQFEVTVVDKETGKFESRESYSAPVGMGYEYVRDYDWMGDVEKAVEDCKMRAKAQSIEPGHKDIILDPTNMWLTIHESCGHPTELDRALGFEANYAGTSFMTPDKLGKLKYGSEHINMVADRTQLHGLATRGYDDDGVKTTKWHLIKEGLFVGYQTTREMAGFINEKESNACAYADSWAHFPIQRMPNISLEPGKKKMSLKDLISDTEDGIYIIGNGSWSIDMQRYNFQFTGQTFWEIKNGKITQMLRDVAYQGNTVDFWNSCDAVCDESEYKLGGSFFCGKGEPGQVSPVSHGASPARFRKVNILNTSRESGK